MKITMMFGSPHLNGTTNALAEQFIRGAQEAGHEVTRLDLGRMKIGPCLACDYCSRTKSGCGQKDDMPQVEQAVREADLIVLVTPLYYYGMSAQLKAAIDRFYYFSGSLRTQPRQAVLLAACADGEGAMDAMIAHYEVLARYLNWKDSGRVLAYNCWAKADLEKTDYPQQAYELGKRIGAQEEQNV